MQKTAIIGTGISGLAAASILHKTHDICVYEKAETIGGHSRTKVIDYVGHEIAVDTGFIVFNYKNYPNLAALFKHLGVAVEKSNMSFGVSADNGQFEWSAENPNSLFGQRSNLVNRRFYAFLLDILRFNRSAVGLKNEHAAKTLGELIDFMGLGDYFKRYYILPMGGAIWSCALDKILDFPAKTFIEFFDAHGLLTVTSQPKWFTVSGGSQEYIKKLIVPFASKIRTNCAVTKITRLNGKVQVSDAKGEIIEYDNLILACHADEALSLLADSTPQERAALGKFEFQNNTAYLHKDVSIMPVRRRCWASWIYHADSNAPKDVISVTYYMNQLQNIDKKYPVFVTLNPLKPIAENDIFDRHSFEHPVYSMEMIAAQKHINALQGRRNTWFCGAYLRYGFHEDGVMSGMKVAKMMGVEAEWA